MTEYEINGKEYEVDYDLDNRIIKVDVDNNDVEYRYDAFGRRVIRKEGTTKTALIWWGNSECAEHKHQAGQTVIQNDIMAHPSRLNSVIARAVDGSKFKLEWYHKNYLDHVYAVSDDSGDILEHYRYTAFGEKYRRLVGILDLESGANVARRVSSREAAANQVQIYNASGNQVATTQIDNHILWNTRRRDEVTGYYMYKFRHYSAELGRWLARDPIEEKGGINLYAFVGNSSLSRWDYLGMNAMPIPPAGAVPNGPDDPRFQDTPTHANGLKSIKDGLALLEKACEKGCPTREYDIHTWCEVDEYGNEQWNFDYYDSKPWKCDKQKCKAEAKKVIDALAATWSRHYGRGKEWGHPHPVAGYYCWDWTNIFMSALNKLDLKCIKYREVIAVAPRGNGGLSHYFITTSACGDFMPHSEVHFDDGFNGANSHTSPPIGRGWRIPNDTWNYTPSKPLQPVIPAP